MKISTILIQMWQILEEHDSALCSNAPGKTADALMTPSVTLAHNQSLPFTQINNMTKVIFSESASVIA